MTKISLKGLLHKDLKYVMKLPDGQTFSGIQPCEIPIRIPQIQRDYAEGRETESVKRKRRNLLTDMIGVLFGQRDELSFDFVYGYMTDKGVVCSIDNYHDYELHPNVVFDPLDGQQRLTTLFLFYWFFGRSNELKGKNNHSLFIYETRPTSEEFCDWLVTKDAKSVVDSWLKLVNDVKAENTKNKCLWATAADAKGHIDQMVNRLRYPVKKIPKLVEYITTLDDFKWDWHDDPNVRSMIVVIESIYNLLVEKGQSYDDGIKNNANLDNITFRLLDNLDCDGDELFEKMNARGKALTHFEEIKSTLEEEIEIQGLPATNKTLVGRWQDEIDKKWVDYCWNTLITSKDPSLMDVRSVEERLERLIIRMIAKSFFNQDIKHTIPRTNDALDFGEILQNSITKDMNKVVDCYIDYALHERSLKTPNGLSPINFERVLNDIDNMLYQDTNGLKDVFQIVRSKGFRFHKDNDKTLLDDYLDNGPTHNVRVMFYAVMAYLEHKTATDIASDLTGIELANFTEWMRFIRNVYLPENKTAALNDVDDANKAIDDIQSWINEFFNRSVILKKDDMLVFIRDYIKMNPFSQEKNRIEEEAQKAELRLSDIKWNNSILDAEENYYLWGQIAAPLSWSKLPNGSYDRSVFDQYLGRLNLVFSRNNWIDSTNIDIKVIQALLCTSDYRSTNGNGLGSLKRFNYHRDYSWKRYLREDNGHGTYGELFQKLLDKWIGGPSCGFDVFLDRYINTNKSLVPKTDWRYYVINVPSQDLLDFWKNIVETNARQVYVSNDDNHVYYFRSETMRTSIRYELVTSYLYLKLGKVKIDHFNGGDGAYVEFNYAGDIFRVSSVPGGLYSIYQNGIVSISNIDIPSLEAELIKTGVITSL